MAVGQFGLDFGVLDKLRVKLACKPRHIIVRLISLLGFSVNLLGVFQFRRIYIGFVGYRLPLPSTLSFTSIF